MYNSIAEERVKKNNGYHVSLKIPRNDYVAVYGSDVTTTHAEEVLENYLQRKEDDGRIQNVAIHDQRNQNRIEIEADLNYEENEHTDYKHQYGHFFTDLKNENHPGRAYLEKEIDS